MDDEDAAYGVGRVPLTGSCSFLEQGQAGQVGEGLGAGLGAGGLGQRLWIEPTIRGLQEELAGDRLIGGTVARQEKEPADCLVCHLIPAHAESGGEVEIVTGGIAEVFPPSLHRVVSKRSVQSRQVRGDGDGGHLRQVASGQLQREREPSQTLSQVVQLLAVRLHVV